MSGRLPERAAVVVLGPSALPLARRIVEHLPQAELHAPAARGLAADVAFTEAVPHLASLFAAGRPIVGLCAAGILIRAVAPLLADKHAEPPLVAVAEDGSSAAPLLGGHRGANDLARAIAALTRGVAAVTTASDLRLGFALDAPPPGWRIANEARVKPVAAALLAGAPVAIEVEAGNADWLKLDHSSPPPYPPPSRGRGSEIATARSFPSPLEGTTRPTASPAAPRGFDRDAIERVVGQGGGTELLRIRVTDRAISPDETALVLHPPVLALGVGCERGCAEEELAALVDETFAEHKLAAGAVALVASVDLKMDEPAVDALGRRLGVPVRFFSAATLEAETPRLATPSDAVFRAVGCHGVAEAAALAAAGADGDLIVAKRRSARATCAVARAPQPLDAMAIGRARGHLSIVGIGPGDPQWRTMEAQQALAAATDIVGYGLYLDLLGPAITGKARHESGLGAEEARARKALDLAAEGRRVALVSSGDAGIYGLATLVFELLDREARPEWQRVAMSIVPGISALQAAAARLGAPLGHDFCTISLSDLLTPWPVIEKRLRAAAEGDFVVALYNPRSARRQTQLAAAREIFLAARPPETPVALARNLGRDGEAVTVTTLAALKPEAVDMLTLVMIGSNATRTLPGARPRLYTPRGYERKRQGEAP